MAIVKLKRARNSLLNASKLPPEILGDIFRRNVTLKGDFGGLGKESHNFLLVCYYWHKVALSTPDLWSFWGNTPRDWARWCRRSWTAPLDLVLYHNGGGRGNQFDATLFGVLQNRANRDTIRRIHIKTTNSELLNSVISSVFTNTEEPRTSRVESFIVQDGSDESVDISNFFASTRFPKLQRLELSGCTISSWDLITSQISTLTTLDLDLYSIEPIPTISNVLPILASNPTLRKVTLFGYTTPGGGGNLSPRPSLHHLKELKLGGDLQTVFGILDGFEHPKDMENLDITLRGCTDEDVSRIIGPHVRDYLRHRRKSCGGLGLSLSSGYDVEFHIGDAGGIDFSAPTLARMNTFLMVSVEFDQIPSKDRLEKTTLDLFAHVPRDEIVYFRAYGSPMAMEEISARLPNLRGLHFERVPLSTAFPKANPDNDGEIFPSLRYISLARVVVDRGDGWGPLVTLLSRRADSGRRLHSLVIVGSYRTRPGITQGMVQEFRLNP